MPDIEEFRRRARNKPAIVGCGSGSSGISVRDLIIESIAAIIKSRDIAKDKGIVIINFEIRKENRPRAWLLSPGTHK